MDFEKDFNNAIEYIENHLTEKIDYEELAKSAYMSKFHFQRVFGIVCGCTVGEYIRKRRLTLAGNDLLCGKEKVIDIAFKYCYETPEGFARAFFDFHGVLPSAVRKEYKLKSFSRICFKNENSGGEIMDYIIREEPEQVLVGYKKRFTGVPYGEERARQEEEFITTTRAKQWLLLGATCEYSTDYCIVTNIDDDGYDFYIAYKLDEWTRKEMFNPEVTGVDFMEQLGFETVVIPKQTYAIFSTEKQKRPTKDYIDLRKRIITEWLPNTDYILAEGAEVVAYVWRPQEITDWKNNKYIEVKIPVKK